MITGTISPNHPILENTRTGIKITWQGKKDWGRFGNTAFMILLHLIVIGILLYYFITGNYAVLFSQTLTLVMVFLLVAYMLYRIYRLLMDLTNALLAHETIQVDDQALTITRSGFMNIQREVAYPADKIRSISSTSSGHTHGLYPVFLASGDILTRNRLGTDEVFCRGISEVDAEKTLTKIHELFPRYQVVKA
jgi:hypothetical protein